MKSVIFVTRMRGGGSILKKGERGEESVGYPLDAEWPRFSVTNMLSL
jgi:hypothetical protein